MSEATTKILVDVFGSESRVARVERGQLTEVLVHRAASQSIVSNIYKGKVVRVVPGMRAAFVDIGLEKPVFLYVDDVIVLDKSGSDHAIESMINPGQEIIVQIIKDSIGTKAPRVSMNISFPGQFLVLNPLEESIGISRRIQSQTVRDHLLQLIESMRPKSVGFIVRTAAQDASGEDIKRDIEKLLERYAAFKNSINTVKSPGLVLKEETFIVRSLRDLCDGSVSQIVINDEDAFHLIGSLIASDQFRTNSQVVLFDEKIPIFEWYGVEKALANAMESKVWLDCGAYLVIESTEALTTIDVNSGKFIGKEAYDENILKINREAAVELAKQLRIRDIGGIIAIDFIDMDNASHRTQLFTEMSQLLERDRARTKLLPLNELGLMHLTRKRTSQSLGQSLTTTCYICNGLGRVKSPEAVLYGILRTVDKTLCSSSHRSVEIELAPWLLELIRKLGNDFLKGFEKKWAVEVHVKPLDSKSTVDQFKVIFR